MITYKGTIRKLGLEGGLWALITDDGRSVELVGAPAGLQRDGLRAEVSGTKRGAEVSIGMVGDLIAVQKWKRLDG